MSRFEVYCTPERVATAAAQAFVDAAHASVSGRGAFLVALPGGATPRPLYRLLAAEPYRDRVDWDRVHIFTSDERSVPQDHPDSNFGLLRTLLLDPVGLPVANRHRVATELAPDAASAAYSAEITRRTGDDGLDMVLLGMGEDGHVASLFPGAEALRAIDRGLVATAAPQLGAARFTLTLPEIRHARRIVVLVTDVAKARVLAEVRSGAAGTPAALLAGSDGRVTWLVDWATANEMLASDPGPGGDADLEALKQQAGVAAAHEVRSGMIVGLGTGSTARYVVETLGARRRLGELKDIRTVPTSQATEILARIEGLPIADLASEPRLDLTLDGADEISPTIDLVKGLGGALLREKIVAAASDRLAIVADRSKLVSRLGTRSPVPVAVAPFGWQQHLVVVRDLGGAANLRTGPDSEPYRTDDGLYLLDCHFADGMDDPAAVDRTLRDSVGVVETGLFLGMADTAYVADARGVLVYRR